MLTPQFSEQGDRERYEAFMADLVDLIVDKYDGSLKAEHGTGVNMAPFVEREWGERATELMWRVKELADPDGVLAPGVLLNRDPEAHLHNLKSVPPIHEEATTCVECGFCEPVCPSRWLTTTPRQRIVLLRELARQPAGLAGASGPARGVRVRRRSRPAPPTAPAPSPARWGSTPARSSRTSAGRSGRPGPRPRHCARHDRGAPSSARPARDCGPARRSATLRCGDSRAASASW